MPFHCFETIEATLLTPLLSSGRAPIIEGGDIDQSIG